MLLKFRESLESQYSNAIIYTSPVTLFYKTVGSEQHDLAVNISRPDLKYLKIFFLIPNEGIE